jgi:hypothetical protein
VRYNGYGDSLSFQGEGLVHASHALAAKLGCKAAISAIDRRDHNRQSMEKRSYFNELNQGDSGWGNAECVYISGGFAKS